MVTTIDDTTINTTQVEQEDTITTNNNTKNNTNNKKNIQKNTNKTIIKQQKQQLLIQDQSLTPNDVDATAATTTPTIHASCNAIQQQEHQLSNRLFVVDGQVNGYPIKVTIDCGATHNFISQSFIDDNAVPGIVPCSPLSLEVANGNQHHITTKLHAANLQFGSFDSDVDLHVFPLSRHQLILGLPWLTKYNPPIDWSTRTFSRTDCLTPAVINLMEMEEFSSLVEEDSAECFAIHLVDATTPPPAPFKENLALQALLHEYADIFPEQLTSLPPLRQRQHEITLQPQATPVRRAPYRLSVAEEDHLRTTLQELLDLRFIRPSVSPWAAPILFVSKKDGTLRFCVDYRQLNKLTVRDEHPLPVPEDLIRRLHGATVFTKLDLYSGYYQIRVAEKDIAKTAFTTSMGLYEFVVMPFGLTNAPATFSRIMYELFADYLNDFVVLYLDDILIYSTDMDQHLRHFRLVLARLREHQFYAKMKKCSFAQPQVTFLGYVVSANGVHMEDPKVQDLIQWPTPQSTADVRSFIGLAGFYRQFIRHFAHIAAPLTDLISTKRKFTWTPLHQGQFDALKKAITDAPVLAVYNANAPCIVYTDASNHAVGGVLLQPGTNTKLHPVAFFSTKLKGPERNYDARTKEFLAIKMAAIKWRPYLHNGQSTVFHTDHQSLQYLNPATETNSKFVRWHALISSWIGPFTIVYTPKLSNVVADALSRRPDHIVAAISVVVDDSQFHDNIVDGLRNDTFAQAAQESITKNETTSFFLDQNLLFRYHDHGIQLYLPAAHDLRETVIRECHDIRGHFGLRRTLKAIQQRFFWPRMKHDVDLYIKSCQQCQRNKSSTQRPAGLLQPLEIPSAPFESISMDFITALPTTTTGFDALMVVVDRFSKYVEFIPTHTTATAADTATLFYTHIVCRHGCPRSIVSDRDSKFLSSFWTSLWTAFGTKLKLGTAYHPQTDGQTERMNRVLEEILRSYCSRHMELWDSYLAPARFAYNNTVHASTKQSPFMILHGRSPLLPTSYIVSTPDAPVAVTDWLSTHDSLIKHTRTLIARAQQNQKRYADRSRRPLAFNVNDDVLLRSSHATLTGLLPAKLKPRFVGPFKVLKRIGSNAYKIAMPTN